MSRSPATPDVGASEVAAHIFVGTVHACDEFQPAFEQAVGPLPGGVRINLILEPIFLAAALLPFRLRRVYAGADGVAFASSLREKFLFYLKTIYFEDRSGGEITAEQEQNVTHTYDEWSSIRRNQYLGAVQRVRYKLLRVLQPRAYFDELFLSRQVEQAFRNESLEGPAAEIAAFVKDSVRRIHEAEHLVR
jgi:hypothetical protein